MEARFNRGIVREKARKKGQEKWRLPQQPGIRESKRA